MRRMSWPPSPHFTPPAPAIILLLLPYSLLLALLYSLGKLSTNREIIAIIQSGRGVVRTTLPLIIAGAFCTLLTLGLNYHWAPIAEGRQDEILAEASGELATEATRCSTATQRAPALDDRRVSARLRKGRPLLNVEVTTTDEKQMLQSRLSASQRHLEPRDPPMDLQRTRRQPLHPGRLRRISKNAD
jgi:lipopolysaccharide export system permease protein